MNLVDEAVEGSIALFLSRGFPSRGKTMRDALEEAKFKEVLKDGLWIGPCFSELLLLPVCSR